MFYNYVCKLFYTHTHVCECVCLFWPLLRDVQNDDKNGPMLFMYMNVQFTWFYKCDRFHYNTNLSNKSSNVLELLGTCWYLMHSNEHSRRHTLIYWWNNKRFMTWYMWFKCDTMSWESILTINSKTPRAMELVNSSMTTLYFATVLLIGPRRMCPKLISSPMSKKSTQVAEEMFCQL